MNAPNIDRRTASALWREYKGSPPTDTDLQLRQQRSDLFGALYTATYRAGMGTPVLASGCAVMAAVVLAQTCEGATVEGLVVVVRACWRARRVATDVRLTDSMATLPISTEPGPECVALADELVTLCEQSGMPSADGVRCVLTVAAIFAGSSLAITGADFERAVRAAWERRECWFEMEAA